MLIMKSKKKPLVKEVFFLVHFLSNLGGSLKATAKNKVTTARVRIRTYAKASIRLSNKV